MNPSEPQYVAPAPAEPQAPAAPASDREQMYARMYAAENPAAPAALQSEAPAPVVEATPPPLTQEQILSSLVDKIGQLEQKLNAPPAPVQPTVAPPPTASASETADWLDLLAKGDRQKAEIAMAQMIAKHNGAQQNALESRVLAQVDAQRSMQEFTAVVRSQNADIAEMESYIGPRVQLRLNQASAAGQIQTPADYATVYRNVLTEEVKTARELYLRIRGVGATAAQVRSTQVAAAPTLAPNPVTSNREPAAQPGAPEIETPEAYLAKRLARSAVQRGLSVA